MFAVLSPEDSMGRNQEEKTGIRMKKECKMKKVEERERILRQEKRMENKGK